MERRRRITRKPLQKTRRKAAGDLRRPPKKVIQLIAGIIVLVFMFTLNIAGIDFKQNILFKDINYEYMLKNIPKFKESGDIAVFFETPIEESDGKDKADEAASQAVLPQEESAQPQEEIEPETTETDTNTPNEKESETYSAKSDTDKLVLAPAVNNKFSYLAVTDDKNLMLLTDLMENDDTKFNPDELPSPEQVLKTAPKLKFSYILPLKGRFTSGFGYREHPVEGGIKFHFGIDLAADINSTIAAFAAGTVVETGYSNLYGNYVKISHTGGILSFYGHCNKITVKKGQKVKKGGKIATVGSTGVSTGPHLHFEVRKGTNIINPEEYFKGKL